MGSDKLLIYLLTHSLTHSLTKEKKNNLKIKIKPKGQKNKDSIDSIHFIFEKERRVSSFLLHSPIPIGHMLGYDFCAFFGGVLAADGFYEIAFWIY